MPIDVNTLIAHDMSDDCPSCRAMEFVELALLPAASAWEMRNELPRFSMAMHGAAGLLGAMMEEGVARGDIESALSNLLDDIEQQISEDDIMGGPPQGTA